MANASPGAQSQAMLQAYRLLLPTLMTRKFNVSVKNVVNIATKARCMHVACMWHASLYCIYMLYMYNHVLA